MICVGCETEFFPIDPRTIRCKKDCGRTSQSHHTSRTATRRAHIPHFIGLDGEGIDTPQGHRYVVLSIGDRSYHLNGERLSAHFIFESLWTEFQRNPNAVFVGFALGYDFSQWFQDLPEDRARMLYDASKRQRTGSGGNPIPFPMRWGVWEMDILNGKRFKLRKGKTGPWMYVCDTFPFWQASFLKTVDPSTWNDPICSQDEYEILVEGKSNRSIAVFDKAMLKYNTLENSVLARLMDRLNVGYVNMGVRLKKSQWFGPGQAAQEWLKLIKAPTAEAVQSNTPPNIYTAARGSYFGGWFEITTHGHIPNDSYEYDINSAYPAVIATLPCLLHGKWIKSRNQKPMAWQLVYATILGSGARLGPHMHRDAHGHISRQCTTGWIWRHELDANIRAGLVKTYTIHRLYTYHPCKCPPPIQSIEQLYDDRLKVGKNTPEGKARKLVYNSCYGKFAQSVGRPMFANPIYASLITAGCRTNILNAIATHPDGPDSVLMIATDAVYFRTPHPNLPITTKLGEWDVVKKHNLTIMMPGVYWDDNSRQTVREGKTPVLKARGVSGRNLAKVIDTLDRQWTEWNDESLFWPQVDVLLDFIVTSPRSALNRGRWDQCGNVSHGSKITLTADPELKRISSLVCVHPVDGTWVTWPRRYSEPPVSTPYDGLLGEQVTSVLPDMMTVEGPFNLVQALDN